MKGSRTSFTRKGKDIRKDKDTSRGKDARRNRGAKWAALLLLAALAAAALSLCLGVEPVSLREVAAAFLSGGDSTAARIVRHVRLPRTCAGLLAGAALACAGVIVQLVLANPLAAPSTIGVNAGAGLAAAVCCAVFPSAVGFVPIAALFGAFGGAVIVLAIAERTGASRLTLVLAGVAVSGIFSAGVDAVVTFVPEALNGYSDFRIGGLSGVAMDELVLPACLILLGILAALSLHNELDVLALGTEQAQALGLSAKKLRLLALALAAMLAGAAVSFAGLLGFVGLIAPHMMRRLVGEESGPLLLCSALGGAALLTFCDLLSRLLFAPYELPVGILLSLLGGPFFIWLLLRQRGGRHA